MISLLHGDCREVLATLPERCVQVCITSPPYFGLRAYSDDPREIGREATYAAYVASLVAVFREVKRVLRADGTLWLNIGDIYSNSSSAIAPYRTTSSVKIMPPQGRAADPSLRPKNLIGIPWRVAFALQDDGWVLRQEIIWEKPNAMPESVTDRPTRAHEYLFLLAKQPRYYYDAAAIAEPAKEQRTYPTWEQRREAGEPIRKGDPGVSGYTNTGNGVGGDGVTRNKRSVWSIPTSPYAGAHFATFPEALAEPCILAGSAARACPSCGAAWRRGVERTTNTYNSLEGQRQARRSAGAQTGGTQRVTLGVTDHIQRTDRGFQPSCACPGNDGSGRSVVLDPFAGSGTVLRVAERLGRDSIGIDLAYQELQEQRTNGVQTMMGDLL